MTFPTYLMSSQAPVGGQFYISTIVSDELSTKARMAHFSEGDISALLSLQDSKSTQRTKKYICENIQGIF